MARYVYFLLAWLAFDVLIFIWAWWDDFYFSPDLKNKFRRLRDTFTEE